MIIERNGALWIAAGASGGSHIISATIQVDIHDIMSQKAILNVIQNDDHPQKAIAAPRFHHQLIPNIVNKHPFKMLIS